MNTRQQATAILVLVMGLVISGCGPGQLLGPTPTPTPIPPTLAPTPIPPTPTLVPPTATPAPALPAYSQVLKTYPQNAQLCCTNAEVLKVTADGKWTLAEGGKICPGKSVIAVGSGGLTTGEIFFGGKWKSYGAKITIKEAVVIDGKSYQPGTKLTVDKDVNWIEVSSWD